ARLPRGIATAAGLEHWLATTASADALRMTQADLLRPGAQLPDPASYPDELSFDGNHLPLEYRFEPGAPDDGITLVVPKLLLPALDADQLAWLVPGWREEKITAVMRALPKPLRKLLVPVPEGARAALHELDTSRGFFEGLAAWVSRRTGTVVSAADLAALPLPDHLRMNFRVIDEDHRVVAEG